jgi:hypothetical protein
MKLPSMLDDRFSMLALALYCVIAAAIILISTVSSHSADVISEIQKNPNVAKASLSSGPIQTTPLQRARFSKTASGLLTDTR